MKIDSIDNDLIRKCIPNVVFEVDGETPIAEKLAPWIQSAKDWLESEYLGPDDFLDERDNNRAVYIILHKALADAIPSLDLVVTPTGFGVVNTETIAPASKERIERLIDSLRNKADGELEILLEFCHQYTEWRASDRGKYFCATFLSAIRDWRRMSFNSYDAMRTEAMHVEAIMEEQYFGHDLMTRLRDEFNSRKPFVWHPLADPVRSAVIDVVYRGNKPLIPTIWHKCRPIIENLQRFPEYYDIWKKEIGNLFDHLQFKNDIKGSYYF